MEPLDTIQHDACQLVRRATRHGPQTHQRMATLLPAARDEVVAAGTVVSAAQPQSLRPCAQELRRLLLRLRGPSTPWLHGGHLTQEIRDVLQCHAAGHRLERRWYGDVDEQVLLNRSGLVAGVQLDLLRIQTDLRGPAEVVRSREPVGSGGSARLARLWIDDARLWKPGGWLNMGEGDALPFR